MRPPERLGDAEANVRLAEVVAVVIVGEEDRVDRGGRPRRSPVRRACATSSPHPKPYRRPGGRTVGRVSSRHRRPRSASWASGCVRPAGPVTRDSTPVRGRVPRQCVVGDLLPAVLGGQEVCPALELLDLGDRVRLVVLRVRPLDIRRHEMVLAARDEEQQSTVVVSVVDPRSLVAGLEVGEHDAPQDPARCRNGVAFVQRSRVLLADVFSGRCVGGAAAPAAARRAP